MKELLQCKYNFSPAKKVLVTILCSVLLSLKGYAQFVNIPDPNFAAFLQNTFPGCMSGNNLDTTCSTITNLSSLNIFNAAIQDLTGVQYFDNLDNLDCHGNSLTALPPLPAGIITLNINDNYFSVLPALPPTIAQLFCSSNLLYELPPLPATLKVLNCGNNKLSSLPELTSLTFLGAAGNKLTSLPDLPIALANLVVSNNHLSSLPSLPEGLISISCNDNFLTSLPDLPSTLLELRCATNLLQTLPALPPNLDYLGCATNQITTLPVLPVTLNTLSAHDNVITELLPFPGPVFSCEVDLSYNPIECLPPLPDSIRLIFCNTPIKCMPNIPNGSTFYNCNEPLPPLCSPNSECMPYNIAGYSFEDLDGDCIFDFGEPPLAGRLIQINSGQYYTSTDANGYYTFTADTPGTYQLSQVNINNLLWSLPCNGNMQLVTILSTTDTFNELNFPNQIISYCPLPYVDIATGGQLICSGNNEYSIEYGNKGTLTAFNTYIEITFDPEIIPLFSTLPWTSVNGNTFHFDVGTISPGEHGTFLITDSISCNALVDQTACVKANVFPASTCEPIDPIWDLSDLSVTGTCNATNDTIKFVVKNEGQGDMIVNNTVTIYEDDLLMGEVTIDLDSGDSIIINQPTTGATYRVEAPQNAGHPGESQPRDFQELCGNPPYSFNKIIPVVQDDADEWVEIDCHLITSSIYPNQKSAQPSGVGPYHLISPNDELDYTIQFQNTGLDTAYNVEIIDTLDTEHLDITSIQPGAASDKYSFFVDNSGVASFAFNNIHLPQSSINEPASHGFVKYKIRQKEENSSGTIIDYSASILFDYNLPINTQFGFVTIANKDSIFISSVPPLLTKTGYQVVVFPNPFDEKIQFIIDGPAVNSNYSVTIFNLLGEQLYTAGGFHVGSFIITPDLREDGIYFYKIYDDKELLGAGKLIRKKE
jgi:hypothetical protein